jgi:hypothetical protein
MIAAVARKRTFASRFDLSSLIRACSALSRAAAASAFTASTSARALSNSLCTAVLNLSGTGLPRGSVPALRLL